MYDFKGKVAVITGAGSDMGAAIVKKHGKKKVFYGCERYPDCDFTSWDMPVKTRCPKCGGLMVQKHGQNGTFVQCADPNCKEILRKAKKTDA